MEDPKALRVHSLGHCFFCLKKVQKKVGAHQGTYHSLRNLSFWFGGFLRFNILKTHEEVLKNAAKNDLQVELCGRCEEYKKRIDEFVLELEKAVCRVKLTAGVIKELIEKADDADLTQSTVECIPDDPKQYTAFSQKVLESARKEIVRKCNIELKRDVFSKKDFTEFRDLMGYDDYVPAKVALNIDAASAVVKKEKEETDFSVTSQEGECSSSHQFNELAALIKLEKNECANDPISAIVKTIRKDPKALRVLSLGHCFFCLKKVQKKVGAHQGTYHSLRNLSFWFGGFLRFNILKTHEEVSKNAARNDLQVELCGRCEEYNKRIDEFVCQLEEAVCRVQLTAGVIKELIEKADDADLTQSIVECTTDDPKQFAAFSQDVLESARKEIVRKCNIELKRDFSKKDFTEVKDWMGYDDYVPAKVALNIDAASAVVKKEKEEADFSATSQEVECSSSPQFNELASIIKVEKNECEICENVPISATVKTEKEDNLHIFESKSTQTDTAEAENNEAPKPNSPCEPTNTTSVEDANSLNPSVPTDTNTRMENPTASDVNNVSAPSKNVGAVEEGLISASSSSVGGHLRPRHLHQSTGQHQDSLAETTPTRAASVSKQSTMKPAMRKPRHSAILSGSSQGDGKAVAGPSGENLVRPSLQEDIEMVRKISSTQFECTLCTKPFTAAPSAKRHYEIVHLELRYPCKLCNFKFKRAHMLRRHLKKCIERRENAKKVVEGKHFLCETCLKVFSAQQLLENHKKVVHLKLGNNFACELCDKRFQRNKDKQEHKNAMHLGIISECVKPCKVKYKHKSALRNHQKNCQIFQQSKLKSKQAR